MGATMHSFTLQSASGSGVDVLDDLEVIMSVLVGTLFKMVCYHRYCQHLYH